MRFKHILLTSSLFIYIACSLQASLIRLKSDHIIYDEYLKRLDATGHVQLELNDTTIEADKLSFYVKENYVMSTQNVTIKRNGDFFHSSSLFIDLDKEALTLKDIEIAMTPPEKNGHIHINVHTLIDQKKKKYGKKGFFTTCNEPHPHYGLSSWRFLYYPDKSIHLIGAQFRNDLSFFPFSVIPIPMPIVEWIPIPYYYYQLGERKISLDFPTIGEKKSPGWGWFVQNSIDYKYKHNKASTLYVDWFEAKDNRSGEWGYGILHQFGNKKNFGSLYVYNYDFQVDQQKKKNLVYELKQTFTVNTTSLSGQYKRTDVDERINSRGSTDSLIKSLSLSHNPQSFPLSLSYNESNQYSSKYNNKKLTFKKDFLHQSTQINISKSDYTTTQRENLTSTLVQNNTLQKGFKLKQTVNFNQIDTKTDAESPDQVLKYDSVLSKNFAKKINMSIQINYLHDIDQDNVTSDIKNGGNNYLYKLPEITISSSPNLFKNIPLSKLNPQSTIIFGNYREVRYLSDNPNYALPQNPSMLEPNVYQLKQRFSKSFSKLPGKTTLSLKSGYEQYIFKNEKKSLFEGDAQYKIDYSANAKSVFFSFIEHNTTYSRSHGHKDNNSPFYAFRRTFPETNSLSESLTFFYNKKATPSHNYTLDIRWEHKSGYNWLRTATPYTDYYTQLNIKYNTRYTLKMGFSKKLNDSWKKENNLFSPLNINLTGKTKGNHYINYLLNLNLNDIVFDDAYNVVYSTLNLHFPIGKKKEFQWDIKAYFNYKNPGQHFSLGDYEFQTLSVVKKEHERQLEIGYNKVTNELLFKFTFNMFPGDPFILRRRDNIVKFEGRLTQSSKERF